MAGLIALALVAGPMLTLAWLARDQFARSHYVAGAFLASACIIWTAILVGVASGSALTWLAR